MDSRDLFVTNASGLKISVTHSGSGKDAAVILAPGFFTSKDTKTFRRLAADLSDRFGVVAMDFRGHGRSEGRYAFSAREAEDLAAVVAYARASHRKVGVLGFSYGGAIAILQASADKNIDSLVCVSAPMAPEEIEFSWWKPESMRLGLLKFERGNGVRPANPFLPKTRAIDVVGNIAPIPALFLHGTNDPTVHHRHSERLHAGAKAPKAIRLFERGSHAEDLYRSRPDEFLREIRAWFDRTLC